MAQDMWNVLSKVNIEEKEKYQELFSALVQQVKNNSIQINIGETEYTDHFLVIEENRMGAYFLHIVPKIVYSLFKEMQIKAPQSFLGFSVLAGKRDGKDIRVSCFGVQCTLLAKSLSHKTIPE